MSQDSRSPDPQLAADLRARMKGEVLAAGDPGYDAARSVWNGMIDRRPALIARCLGTADVIACVNAAREYGLPVSIKGGGHNIAGLAVADGALTVDMSHMRGVWTDPAARRARAQAGCLLGDVDRETQLHGLAAVLGFVSNTGIAGLTLGGGFGYLSRRFGWTGDNVRGMDVVTADGRLVRASRDENPDLFWGLRGGGGNFGVVTGFDYDLFPVGPEIHGGPMAWRGEDAAEVLAMYREVAANAPRELSVVAVLRPAPPAPWLPPEVHGKFIVIVLACYTGPESEADRVLAPIRGCGKPVGSVLQRRPYTSLQSLLDATQPKGRRYYWKSEYLPGFSADLLKGAAAKAAKSPSPHSAILVFPLGGAVREAPADESPAGNRDAEAVLNIAGSWDTPADDAVNIAWARDAWEALRGFGTGGSYINFQTEEEGEDRIRGAYGANHSRLVEVKKAWDPHNLFCVNKNILPRD